MSESPIDDGYMRVMLAFDRDETAGSFLRDDGEGGFASGVYRMAREIERLRAALGRIEGIHRRNFGRQTEKLADIGPIAREALNFKEAQSDEG